jgi:glycosyltransferase involved in cell wall biosynthesis
LTIVRVLYVWDAEYPWDVRTEKVCLALARAGHEVFITARNLRQQPLTEARPEGTVVRLAPGRRKSFPAFFNPFWRSHLRRMIRQHRIDLVMVRDLPLAPTALYAARQRIPVVLDMAENYPAMMRDIWTDGRARWSDNLVRNPRIVAAVERWVLKRLDHVITVVEESSDRLVSLGYPRERTTVVSNTPPLARIGPLKPRIASEPLRVVYLGLIEGHRGIGTTLEAAALLQQAGVRFHLDVVGDGRDFDLFTARAEQLKLAKGAVTFHGRLAHADAITLFGQAHVGLVPHEARESWNTTIPNKLFDYMAAGLATISSDAVPAARVVRATGCGLIFRSGNAAELADCIRQCLDLETWGRFRRAGQDAIRTYYNWERDTMALLRVVTDVAAAASAGQGYRS